MPSFGLIVLLIAILLICNRLFHYLHSAWLQFISYEHHQHLSHQDDDSDESEDEDEEIPPLLHFQLRRGKLPPTMLWEAIPPPKPAKSKVIRPRGIKATVRKTSL